MNKEILNKLKDTNFRLYHQIRGKLDRIGIDYEDLAKRMEIEKRDLRRTLRRLYEGKGVSLYRIIQIAEALDCKVSLVSLKHFNPNKSDEPI